MKGQWKNCVHTLSLSQTLLEQWPHSPEPLRHSEVVLLNRNSSTYMMCSKEFHLWEYVCLFRKILNFSSSGIIRLCMISAERSAVII